MNLSGSLYREAMTDDSFAFTEQRAFLGLTVFGQTHQIIEFGVSLGMRYR